MPQMFPLNWIILYIYFIIIFFLLIINNFYYTNLLNKTNYTLKMNSNKMSWKW
uniref:ATP synthase complex subunit 8 n=1 Tax=Analcellicampa danfengensis TaxID=2419779 RepID=A0A7U0FNY0_9HYME|nr:ATP synthase F0 subunit 8 [Analcellicampa danfengensis]QQV69250.1 ATP synthase F0 subunit 8 [Analcellicampa danfengensis]